MKLIILMTLCFLSTTLAFAGPRKQYRVTGHGEDVNAFYHDIYECSSARADAKEKANEKCYREGYDYATRLSLGGCKSKLFGGKSVSATFFCK